MKFKALLPAFAALAIAAAATAQPTAPAPDFSPDAFRAHVATLADDRLEGREAGTRGYDLAADYVAAQYEALGLRPAAAGGSWFQPVQLVGYQTVGTPRLAVGRRSFSHGRDFVLRAGPDSQPFAVEAPLVFAGYGLDLPERGFDDYRGLDVRGKIVVVLNGHPIGTPSDVGAHLDSEKPRMAAERGAVGMLVIRTNGESESLPWTRFARYMDRPRMTWVGADGRPDSHGLRFNATVDRTLATIMFSGARRSLDQVLLDASRHGGRPEGFALAQNARFEREGARLTRVTSPNVIGLLPGTDPSVADEIVLLMAHLDGLGISDAAPGERPGEDRIRNGAMDNASGVATLIEVARVMSRPGNRPRRPVLFAAVTAEEVGLLGASYLAENPPAGGRIVSVVNLDMPVLTYPFQDVTAFGAEHSTLGPIVERAAARMGVRVSPDPLPDEGLFTRSDHYAFVRRGIPSVFLMTGFAGDGRRRFTAFLEDFYHSPRDDLSQPFDWNAGARFARLNYLIAREIADEAEAPLWYADSFFGAAVGRGQTMAQRPRAGGAENPRGQAAPR